MHNLDMSNNRANIAFLGSRKDVWHRMGQEMLPGMSIEEWAKQAGLGWTAYAVPAIAHLEGAQFDHLEPSKRFSPVPGQRFICRGDTGFALGYVSDGYQIVQPRDVLDWFDRYIRVDDRFALDTAGSLNGGRTIWALAKFNGDLNVAGDSHSARVLMSTTFDGTGSTINQATTTRVVCENTIRVAWADNKAVVRTRHSTRFDAARVGKELSQIAQSFAHYKAIGDAMASHELSREQVVDFFKDCLDIPRDAKRDDISTRKQNQFADLGRAFGITKLERNLPNGSADAWTALQAVTRYVDHDRATRKDDTGEAQFASAQFGSGDQLKGKALQLLMPLVRDKVLVSA